MVPAQTFYVSALGRGVDYAVYGVKTSCEALRQATNEARTELDLRLIGR